MDTSKEPTGSDFSFDPSRVPVPRLAATFTVTEPIFHMDPGHKDQRLSFGQIREGTPYIPKIIIRDLLSWSCSPCTAHQLHAG